MAQRLVLPRRTPYNTKSNRKRIVQANHSSVKTPGGKLVYQHMKKMTAIPKCGDCKIKLSGITPSRPCDRAAMSKRLKTVSRSYGGSRCHACVRNRIIRAFLLEEQKIVMKVLKLQAKK